MVPSPQGTGRQGGDSRPKHRTVPRSLRKRVTVTAWYRGGPEGSFIITARGKTWRFDWHQSLGDVLQFIADGYPYRRVQQ